MSPFRAVIPLILLSAIAVAQQSAPAAIPRLCVANVRNETKLDISMPKLRDLLVSQIKQGNLARNSRLEVLPLTEDTEEQAMPELRQQHCDFAVYPRLMMFRFQPHDLTTEGTVIYRNDEGQANQQLVPGIQFTVVRIQSGIPILIDRRIATKPYQSENDLLPLVEPVGDRIQRELEKRLLAPAKPGI